jgi:hypothetical protein
MKESSGGGEFNMIYLMYFRNLCKYSNVHPPSTTTIKKYIYKQHVGEDMEEKGTLTYCC